MGKGKGEDQNSMTAITQGNMSSGNYLKAERKVATLRRMAGFCIKVRRIWENTVITSRASGEEKSRTKTRRAEESEPTWEAGVVGRRGGNTSAGGGGCKGGLRRIEASRRCRYGHSWEEARWAPWQLWHFGWGDCGVEQSRLSWVSAHVRQRNCCLQKLAWWPNSRQRKHCGREPLFFGSSRRIRKWRRPTRARRADLESLLWVMYQTDSGVLDQTLRGYIAGCIVTT